MVLGEFSGEPRTVWMTEQATADRRMKLVEAFWFRDPAGRQWHAPADAVVNGASIPRALWTVVGSPYTGDYRRASIVHDVACDQAGDDRRERSAADRMFFQACRAGGCSVRQSILLYIGVRLGAALSSVAAWKAAGEDDFGGPRIRRTAVELRLEADFQTIAEQVLAKGETEDLPELEIRTQTALYSVAASGE